MLRIIRYLHPHRTIEESTGKATQIRWLRQEKPQTQATHPGVYALRTDLEDWDEATLWRTYTALTDLEAVFRSLKTEFGLRPVLGFKTFNSARCTLRGVELMHMIKKSQMIVDGDKNLFAAGQFYSLAA